MRTLRFKVTNNTIAQDPSCDFNGLFPGANPNVHAEFIFSPDWSGRTKVAAFWSMLGNEYPPQLLDENNSCEIPREALNTPAFKIQILGRSRRKTVQTNKVTVYQRGGAK